MKKLLLTLGTLAVVSIPIVSVVSCGKPNTHTHVYSVNGVTYRTKRLSWEY